MKQNILLFVSSIFICGCMSKDEQKAIDQINTIYRPDKVSIGSSISAGTHENNLKLKTITITGGESLNNPNVPNESLTSIGAFVFYSNLSSETLKEKDAIKITLERTLNGSINNVVSIYYIDTLNFVNTFFCNF